MSSTSVHQPLTSAARVLEGENPFGVSPARSLLQEPQPSIPNYSETYWFTVWDASHEVGVFIHTGRMPTDLSLWWARTVAFLPGGELVVDRSFGRATDDRGPATGNLSIRQEDGQWSLKFDGAGERTTRLATSDAPAGAGYAVPFRFDIKCRAAAPIWDMGRACGGDDAVEGENASWAHMHLEQGLFTRGHLVVDGQEWELDGIGYCDHSNGPRDMTGFGRDAFVGAVFPESGRVLQGLLVWDRAGRPQLRTFYIAEGGVMELAGEGDIPQAADAQGNPRAGLEMRLRRVNGTELVLPIEILHGVTITIAGANRNMNGAVRAEQDPVLFNEETIRITWPDGEIGYGHMERSLREEEPVPH